MTLINYLDIIRFLTGLVILIIGSYTDLKERRVPNRVWVYATPIGLILLFVQMVDSKFVMTDFLVFIPIAVLVAEEFIDRDDLVSKKHINVPWLSAFAIAFFVSIILIFFAINGHSKVAHIPVLMSMFFIFYYMGLIHGGADAKAFITLTIIMPFYPSFVMPVYEMTDIMKTVFPFTFTLLINSIFAFIFVPLLLLIYNLIKGDLDIPMAFVGYKVDINSEGKYWPMEYVKDGKIFTTIFPSSRENPEDDIEKLKAFGKKRIWVTPKIPFIIPVTIAYIFTIFVGNIIEILMFDTF